MINHKVTTVLFVTVLLVIIFIFFSTIPFKSKQNAIEMVYLEPPKQPNKDKLLDLNFEYLLNSATCEHNDSNILAIIIVTSYFGNVETRSAMRQAFPADKLRRFNLRRVFLLGVAPKDKYTSQKAVVDESKRFGDLIQGNFLEAYRNLTYKHVMGLKWASTYCRRAKYVIKMDDDIVVNIYKTTEILKSLKLPQKKLLAGYILHGMVPKREPANKWYVTIEEYRQPLYPTFVSGWFYVTNPEVCSELVAESARTRYFWVDDVYVTGVLAQKLRIKHFNLGEYFTVHPEFLECCMKDIEKFRFECNVLVGPNGGDNNLFLKFNNVVSKCFYGECRKRNRTLNQTCVAEKKYLLGRGEGQVETYKLI